MAKKAEKTTKIRKTIKGSSVVVADKTAKTSSPVRLKKSYLLWGVGVIVLVFALYFFRSVFIAVTINGRPISRLAVIRELERQGGKQALNAIVTKNLILQEAKRQNVTVSQEEIDKELKRIEENIKRQGQTLDQALMLQGMTKENLVEQIRLQKMIEKIVGKDIKVADKEVDEYIAKNKESLPQDQERKVLGAQVKDQLRQQKLNEKVNSWIESLRKNAKISSFVPYYP
ncbi:MAG: SurA N-terminal domain-containing protein [Candidatus Levybacteria bacterium]|nr:SurA N-terminal domain-containing protein [Candidatus Levybacteria bacterium]